MIRKQHVLSGLLLTLLMACSTVPLVQRNQVTLLPKNYMLNTSLTQYRAFMDKNKVLSNTAETVMVDRVGRRIANAVETYMREHGQGARINNFHWEFKLVEEDTPNAWCMPGGKVAIYTGILSYTKDEAGLAAVMGHEIAHAVARHGNERMSQRLMVMAGGVALDVYL